MSLWQRILSWFRPRAAPRAATSQDPITALEAQIALLASAIAEAARAVDLFRADRDEAIATYQRLQAELAERNRQLESRAVQIKALLLKRGEHDAEAQQLVRANQADEERKQILEQALIPAARQAMDEAGSRHAEAEATLTTAKQEEATQRRLLQELKLQRAAGKSLSALEALTEQGRDLRMGLEAQTEAERLSHGDDLDRQMAALRQSAAQREAQAAVEQLKKQMGR
jgi:septal ring factor EnvC (AmiA/AmiB activator)